MKTIKKAQRFLKSRASSWGALGAVVGCVVLLHVWGLHALSLPQPQPQPVQAQVRASFGVVPAVFVVRDSRVVHVQPKPVRAQAVLSKPVYTPRRPPALDVPLSLSLPMQALPIPNAVGRDAQVSAAMALGGEFQAVAMPVVVQVAQAVQETQAAQGDLSAALAEANAAPGSREPQSAAPQASVASQVRVPESVRLRYRVQSSKLPFGVSGDLWWRRQGEGYEAQLALHFLGMGRTQSSRGRVTEQGLVPRRFSDKYRSEVAAHFEWQAGVVSFSANTPNAVLQPGAQDRLSVMLQLASLVAAAPTRYPPNSTITLQVVGPRAAEPWVFAVQGLDWLDLPGGRLQGLKLIRQARERYDPKIELWLAPTLAYLPARIRITQSDGAFVDQLWAATEPAGDAP